MRANADVRTTRALVAVSVLAIAGTVQACSRRDVTGVTVALVDVSPSSDTLLVGESRSFLASVRDVDGATVPSSLVTWSSSDETVLSMSSGALATALRTGTAEVRATVRGVTGSASVMVEPGPMIAFGTQEIALFAQVGGANPEPVALQIVNGGNGALTGLAATIGYGQGEPGGWLSISLSSTTAPTMLSVTAATASLAIGSYHAGVTLSSPDAQGEAEIGVELSVLEDRPILLLKPSAVGFAAVAGGGPPAAQSIKVINTGGGDLTDLSTNVSYQGVGGWLGVALSSGTAPAVLSLTADPSTLSPGSYAATVRVASPAAVNGPRSLNVSFAVDIEPEADLSVVVSGPATVVVDDTARFVLTVHNDGPRDALNVMLEDSLHSSLSFVRASGGGVEEAGVSTWSLGSMPAGGTRMDTVWALATETGVPVSVARVYTLTKDPTEANDRASRSVAVLPKPADVAVTMAGPAAATAGDRVSYAIDVAHVGGPVDAEDVVLTDALPARLAFVSATAGGTYDDETRSVTWELGDLAVGGRAHVGLTASLDIGAEGEVGNTATVSSAGRDPSPENDTSTATTTVTPVADVAVKATAPAAAAAGTRMTYTIGVAHAAGAAGASQVVVTDVLPEGVSFVSATGDGTYDVSTGTATWKVGDLAVGESTSVDMTVAIGAETVGTLASTATVVSAGPDPVPGNDSSTATTTVTRSSDLAVTVSGPAADTAGTQVTYTVDVTHVSGPSEASEVVVSDALPVGLDFVSAGGGGSYDAQSRTVTWNLGTMAVGGSASLELNAAIAPAVSGEVANTATVSAGGTDLEPGNDSSTVTTVVSRVADLALRETGPAAAVAGSQITFTLDVDHVGGPSDAGGVVVEAPLTAGLSFVSATGGASYDGTSRIVAWSLGDLRIGGSSRVTLTVAVGAEVSGTVTSTATVGGASTDPVAANDAATVNTTVSGVADLAVYKEGPATTGPETQITYTLTVEHVGGPSDADGVVLTDVLPDHVSFVSATGGGKGDKSVVTWNLGSLAAGGLQSVDLTVKVGKDVTGVFGGTATVSSTTTDPVPENDTATSSTTVVRVADLEVRKEGPPSAAVGKDIKYKITVTHVGGADEARNVVVTDVLPPGLTFRSAKGGGTYDESSRTVTWTVDHIGVGAHHDVEMTVRVDPDVSGQIDNTATATHDGTDPDAQNNAFTASTTVSGPA